MLSYDSRSTLIRLNHRKKYGQFEGLKGMANEDFQLPGLVTRLDFFCNLVVLESICYRMIAK